MLIGNGQTPQSLKRVLAALKQVISQIVIVGEQTRSFTAKSHSNSASERGQVNESGRLEVILDVGHGIGEHKSTLSVCVADLNSETLA